MKVTAVIPARYQSTRLPQKVLVPILGKPLLQHVYERVSDMDCVDQVVIATDHDAVVEAANAFNAHVVRTPEACESGTDRISRMIHEIPRADVIINAQADEPMIEESYIRDAVNRLMADDQFDVATVVSTRISEADYTNPNRVKAVINQQQEAMYFSRAPIPFFRDGDYQSGAVYLHAGIYIYRRRFLERFSQLRPSQLEAAEKLEQLRFMENGSRIMCAITDRQIHGVDVPADVEKIERLMSGSDS